MGTPYYQKDGIAIYCGDCLEVMPQLDVTVDMACADLPYGTTACSWDIIIPFKPLWDNYERLIKNNGATVLFGSQPFTSKLTRRTSRSDGRARSTPVRPRPPTRRSKTAETHEVRATRRGRD